MKQFPLAILVSLLVAASAPAAFAAGKKVVSRSEIPRSGFYAQCTPGPGCTSKGYPFAKYMGTPGPRANFYRNIDVR
jgi:hypothetical protein